MLIELIDIFVGSLTTKVEVYMKIILQTIWRALKQKNGNGNGNGNGDGNKTEINLLGWKAVAILSSSSSPTTISLLLVTLLDIMAAEKWEDVHLLQEIFEVITDISYSKNMYGAPIERTLLCYANSLINKTTYPFRSPNSLSESNKRSQLWLDSEQIMADLSGKISGILSSLQLYMTNRNLDIKKPTSTRNVPTDWESGTNSEESSLDKRINYRNLKPKSPSFRPFYSTFQEDFNLLMSIQLFLCLSLPADFTFSEKELHLNFNGDENCTNAYTEMLAASESLKISDVVEGDVSVPISFRESSSFPQRIELKLPNQNENDTVNSNVNEKMKNASDSEISKRLPRFVFQQLWRCIGIFVKQNIPVGHVRTCMIPTILSNMATMELTINKFCAAKNKEKNKILMERPKRSLCSYFNIMKKDKLTLPFIQVPGINHIEVERGSVADTFSRSAPSRNSIQDNDEKLLFSSIVFHHRLFTLYTINILLSSSQGTHVYLPLFHFIIR